MSKIRYAVHETLPVAVLLTAVGGFLEAYTYLLRGEVFCNAQTGNIALLALSLSKGDFAQALYYPLPILAFTAGIWLSVCIKDRMTVRSAQRWEPILLAVEIVCLFGIGFMPQGRMDGIANVAVSFICSLQYNTFRKVNDMPYATTFCTNNLRLTAEHLYRFAARRDREAGRKALRYSVVILAFFLGAVLGTLGVQFFGIHAVWVCCALLAVVLLIMGLECS